MGRRTEQPHNAEVVCSFVEITVRHLRYSMTSWAAIAAAARPSVNADTETDLYSGNVRIAVADATALIKGCAFERIADAVVTVQEVLDEVRDRKARAWLQNLSYKIRILTPNPDAVKIVVKFARDTGDLPFLSVPDIKVLALAFDLEKRIHGTDHLCLTPNALKHKKSGVVGQQDKLPGWGTVENPKDWEAIDRLNEQEETNGTTDEMAPREVNISEEITTKIEELALNQEREESETEAKGEASSDLDQLSEASGEEENTTIRAEHGHVVGDDGWQQVGHKQKRKKSKRKPKDNIEDQEAEDPHGSCVSCWTGDFGIQNVLLQMGLKLMTPDGVRIRHLSTYGLKCAACFKVTRSSDRVFCHSCGNATLYKVRIEVGEDGMVVIGGTSKPPQRRASKCSIPPPKGGKKNKDAILSEDVMQIAMQKVRNMKKSAAPDIMAPEYNEDSWFKTRALKNEIKDQLPGRYGYPRTMTKYVPHRRK